MMRERPLILVCDDEPQIVRALKVILREAGFDTLVAETVQEALDRAATTPPDAAMEGLDRSRIDLRLADELPSLHMDASQLERVFHNLLQNALEHSGTEPVQVRARVVGARMIVRVMDRGPGIPAIEQDRIFEPFYRAPEGSSRSAGSGLGLAIVRGSVEANVGPVTVE